MSRISDRFDRGSEPPVELDPSLPPACRRVQTHLPRLVADEASRLRARWVDRHLDECELCRDELRRQVEVDRRLRQLAPVVEASVADEQPPEWLLGALLERADDPGLRARAAAPARAAVSGARPELTLAAVVISAVVAGALGWLVWRGARRLRGRVGPTG